MDDGPMTPREALEALGFRFEPVPRGRGVNVEVYAPRLPNAARPMRSTWAGVRQVRRRLDKNSAINSL